MPSAATSGWADQRLASPPTLESILVVDDNTEVLALTVDALEAQGYTVLGTDDPCEALDLARVATAPIHLLLTDIVMGAMNGRELADAARRLRPGMKVLFMSAYTERVAHDHEVRINPGEPFLVKPFTLTELAGKVRQVLDRRSAFSRRPS
ncbi:MAG TPA: response regulator [Candidatus Bathyarchaeia archaeon]|nr:response regulator [Candidatus Bathyarchaeia archaeon]